MHKVVISVLAGIVLVSSLAHAQEKEKTEDTLPGDFSLVYTDVFAGMLPTEGTFIEIHRNPRASDGSCLLTSGILTRSAGRADVKTVNITKSIPAAQVLEFYKEAKKIGFFDLRNRYIDDKAQGGTSITMTITGDGNTQRVETLNTVVLEINALLSKIQTLMK